MSVSRNPSRSHLLSCATTIGLSAPRVADGGTGWLKHSTTALYRQAIRHRRAKADAGEVFCTGFNGVGRGLADRYIAPLRRPRPSPQDRGPGSRLLLGCVKRFLNTQPLWLSAEDRPLGRPTRLVMVGSRSIVGHGMPIASMAPQATWSQVSRQSHAVGKRYPLSFSQPDGRLVIPGFTPRLSHCSLCYANQCRRPPRLPPHLPLFVFPGLGRPPARVASCDQNQGIPRTEQNLSCV